MLKSPLRRFPLTSDQDRKLHWRVKPRQETLQASGLNQMSRDERGEQNKNNVNNILAIKHQKSNDIFYLLGDDEFTVKC